MGANINTVDYSVSAELLELPQPEIGHAGFYDSNLEIVDNPELYEDIRDTELEIAFKPLSDYQDIMNYHNLWHKYTNLLIDEVLEIPDGRKEPAYLKYQNAHKYIARSLGRSVDTPQSSRRRALFKFTEFEFETPEVSSITLDSTLSLSRMYPEDKEVAKLISKAKRRYSIIPNLFRSNPKNQLSELGRNALFGLKIEKFNFDI